MEVVHRIADETGSYTLQEWAAKQREERLIAQLEQQTKLLTEIVGLLKIIESLGKIPGT